MRLKTKVGQKFNLLFINSQSSYLLVHYKETSKLFFALLVQLIMSLLSFKVNEEFKGCQECLQSIGWLH